MLPWSVAFSSCEIQTQSVSDDDAKTLRWVGLIKKDSLERLKKRDSVRIQKWRSKKDWKMK